MNKGNIVILSGPSGSGKTTLYQKLLKSKKFHGKIVKSISVTTRPKRLGEKHGRDYLFISKKMFLYKKKFGHFLESEKVFDNYYGTPEKNVREMLKKGKNVLLCIDVKGARTVFKKYPKAVKIFIMVPSLAELKKRLEGRGSESSEVLRLRLSVAKKEISEAKKYQHIVVNDSFAHAYKKLEQILCSDLQLV